MRQLMLNSNAYLKLLPTRTLRIASIRPFKKSQLSPSSGGLGSVLNQPSLVVSRQLEMLNVLIGYEQANKYAIKAADGRDVGFIIEEDSSILQSLVRQFLLTRRSFNASVLDSNGQVVLKIRRPIKWFFNSEIRVYNAQDELLGEVNQVWHLWRRQYELFLGKTQFAEINTEFLGWDFNLVNEKGNNLASVNKRFLGFAREIFTDTGSYAIHLEQDNNRRLSLQERAVVLCCAINIDIDYFSRQSGRGGISFGFWGGHNEYSTAPSSGIHPSEFLELNKDETERINEDIQKKQDSNNLDITGQDKPDSDGDLDGFLEDGVSEGGDSDGFLEDGVSEGGDTDGFLDDDDWDGDVDDFLEDDDWDGDTGGYDQSDGPGDDDGFF